ncbi:hypothetical protein OHB54_04040 [Streptomyces sp. NBC_01007]|nr:hypothetical protein OHB54_04040 [Streptomyces sp. NBC_01007]
MADGAVEELKERERVVEAGHDHIRLERVHRLLETVFESLDDRVDLAMQEVSNSSGVPSHSPQEPPSPPGSPDGRPPAPGNGRTIRRRAVRTGAVVAVTALLALLALRALNAGAAPNAAPDQRVAVASAVTSAMLNQRLVAFDINARPPGDPDFFLGQDRLDMSRKPVRAATHVLYDYGEGHNWTPPDMVLVGGSAYVTPDNTPTTKGAGAYGTTEVVPVIDTVTDLSRPQRPGSPVAHATSGPRGADREGVRVHREEGEGWRSNSPRHRRLE